MIATKTYQESELLYLVAEGDEKAFASLVGGIVRYLEPLVMKIVRSPESCKEVLQECFIRIWLNRDKLPGLENPPAWFKRVALNETFTWLRKNASTSKLFNEVADDTAVDFTATGLDNLAFRETALLLEKAIAELPPQRKLIFQMNRIEGIKSKEIAEKLNLSNGYVKNALSAALESIRQNLAASGKLIGLLLFFY